ncbi:MAG: MBL fold metallo-hydrolase [Oscillospiraceae bacterium]|jgi:glyoxylase-like metal-dependent hydrolase (beta-lactamase superfamily II)|nr:MBL fold metallo-hydrolase [Oscillospiraceae bacterium]
MLIKTLPVGQLETNCYVVTDERTLECAVIDPGAESGVILDYIEQNKLALRAIFLTHGHFDHYLALGEVRAAARVPVYIHERELEENSRDAARLAANGPFERYAGGDEIIVGGLTFTVMETPGHTMGSVTLRCENALFTGDTLFAGSCGRTDLGGDMDTLMDSLRRIAGLEGNFEVYPGHAESTTLDTERKFNYYLKYAVGAFPLQ